MIEKSLVCPVELSACYWLDEVARLRQENQDLSDLVSTDALTGLYNFRHFKNVLRAEMDRSKRSGIPTSLVMVDIDRFKTINDTYGHEVGNLVLKRISGILMSEVRITDIVCRYGGEEFALIFPETYLRLAVNVADRIREKIAMTQIDYHGEGISVTVSMGASVHLKSSILSAGDFVDSVDKYLYEAKESGRNCIRHIDYAYLRTDTEVSVDERAMLVKAE